MQPIYRKSDSLLGSNEHEEVSFGSTEQQDYLCTVLKGGRVKRLVHTIRNLLYNDVFYAVNSLMLCFLYFSVRVKLDRLHQ